MRMTTPALIAAAMIAVALPTGGARADTTPAIKGNDTGGIISYNLVGLVDVREVAVQHCAQYNKVARFLAAQRTYGGYISFACKWVPYGSLDRPLRTRY